MVRPVTEAGAVSADVFLPKGAVWYNYFTGMPMEAGVQHTGKILEGVSTRMQLIEYEVYNN